ncbi:VWA domain-containing protein [Egicoccus sp. AB-alg2]|uniref:VWA domain-containing protein n=1 Tax=Egicoccus sp. AB-alg2 TaxID=3242693 RepID=UPI00359E2315
MTGLLAMSLVFGAPGWLAALAAVAGLGLAYVWVQRRRAKYAVRFTNLDLVDVVMPDRPDWRRHLPPVVVLVALVAMVVALAQPMLAVERPRELATIVLAIDVSPSMQATDVPPSRLAQAREAADRFLALLPDTFDVGLVSFAGTAEVLVPPTQEHTVVRASLGTLDYRSETAIGEAIHASLEAVEASGTADDETVPRQILLLSDGASTVGRPAEEAMQVAGEAGVPVSTIAYGTPDGTVELGGTVVPAAPDEDILQQIAEETGGRFYRAATGEQLEAAYEHVTATIGTVPVRVDVTRWVLAAALVLVLVGGALSVRWFGRLP